MLEFGSGPGLDLATVCSRLTPDISLGPVYALEKEMATHSSVLA